MQQNLFSESTDTTWEKFLLEIADELDKILCFWKQCAVDLTNGGFYGQVNDDNQIIPDAKKGSVLNARILWTFSACYNFSKQQYCIDLATRAYHYIKDHLTDAEYGGLYWTINAGRQIDDPHKQIYAQAFGIYGMSEYFRSSQNPEVLALAISWYRMIEKYSHDELYGGYTEAFTRDWRFLNDQRLSKKDKNSVKSMNTHLHIIEAYANLFSVWPDPQLKIAIGSLLNIFYDRMMNRATHNLGLFYNRYWEPEDTIISYGHDIEAGWLLLSCAEAIDDEYFTSKAKKNAILITNAAIKGIDKDGGLWYEYNYKSNELTAEKHWWPQAEALIGLYNAHQLTGNPDYKKRLLKNWAFIKKNILNLKHGEWFWGVDRYNRPIPNQYKIGLWKCPYHNVRACLEILKRSEV